MKIPTSFTKLFAIAALAIILSTVNAVAATLTVTNTNDGGAGSLRQAVLDASAAVRALSITAGENVSISGMTLTLGNGTGDSSPGLGGAIFNHGGALTLTPAATTLDEKVGDVNVRAAYGKIPLSFEANHGQAAESINFLARGPGYMLALSPGEAVFELARQPQKTSEFSRATAGSKPAESASTLLRMTLRGANPAAAAAGEAELEGKVNYFTGNDPTRWRRNIATFERVRYTEVYPGIDVVYYGNQRRLEYDFVVAPGRDARVISLEFAGAKSVAVDPATGDLLVGAGVETVRQHAPLTYQETANGRREVQSRYALKEDGRVGIEVGEYDTGAPLIIDPVLEYSTFLGGGSTDSGADIAVDSGGNAYVIGMTISTDFPTAGPIQATNRGGAGDAFVTKINAAGTALVYSTYLGGSGQEFGRGIALDSTGNAYITGYTNSSDFPIANPFQATIGGFTGDAFVAKIDATGANLVYSTYLGGTLSENGLGIAVDSVGNAYVIGNTASTNFPTVNPIQPGNNGSTDVFVTKINPAGSGLVYSTQLGGGGADTGFGIAVDSQGSAYITGSTGSANFPTVNPIFPQSTSIEVFVAKLNAAGSALVYSSYLGGTGAEYGAAIAVDAEGNAYVTGTTSSFNFPTVNPIQPFSGGGNADVFVTKVNAAGSALVYSTYLGGSGSEAAGGVAIGGIAVDSAGNAYVTGSTDSTDFPTANAIQPTFGGGIRDAFVTKINAAGSALSYSTYLRGSGADGGAGLALDSANNAYITGSTDSANFPTVAGSFDETVSGTDAFITKIHDDTPPPDSSALLNISTRMQVLTGDQVLIGGFIITGTDPKMVILRAIGPSLTDFGVAGALADPVLELRALDGSVIATNDDWTSNRTAIEATGLQPNKDLESAIVATLDPGAYTAIVSGTNGTTGVGLVEAYDLDVAAASELANISTRGFVATESNVMIGGFILGGESGSSDVLIRAIGPTLADFGVAGALEDPTLELRDVQGTLVGSNDNWMDSQKAEIEAIGLAPQADLESAILETLNPGAYTAIVAGADGGTGVGLVEVYRLR